MLVEAVLEIGLAVCNHFPLFALIIRLKDPDRLSGGVKTSYYDFTNGINVSQLAYNNVSYLTLKVQIILYYNLESIVAFLYYL
jgi:phosphatidylinositol glycan class Q protein